MTMLSDPSTLAGLNRGKSALTRPPASGGQEKPEGATPLPVELKPPAAPNTIPTPWARHGAMAGPPAPGFHPFGSVPPRSPLPLAPGGAQPPANPFGAFRPHLWMQRPAVNIQPPMPPVTPPVAAPPTALPPVSLSAPPSGAIGQGGLPLGVSPARPMPSGGSY